MKGLAETKVYEEQPEDFSPKVEVAAIYVNVSGKLLLLQLAHSKSEPGAWGVTAGKLEAHETPIKGAERELFEETGITIDSENSFRSLGRLYIRKPDVDYIYHIFTVNLDKKPAISLSGEHSAYKWVSRQEAKNLSLMKGAEQALNIYYRRDGEAYANGSDIQVDGPPRSAPFVVGVCGISGAGKSTLINRLSKLLKATVLSCDDFDEISQGPKDYVKWYEAGRNYDDWVYDDLASTLEKLKEGRTVTCPATGRELYPAEYILFGLPFRILP